MEDSEPLGEPISVYDHEAFVAKHMPDLGHDVVDLRVFSWRLQRWKTLDKRTISPEFECGGHRWRILLFPIGVFNAAPNESASIYLDYADPKSAPEGWHVCAQFALVMSNLHDPTDFVVRHAHHRFTADECDWGFTRFHELRHLYQSPDGRKRPIIEDDGTIVSGFVRVLKDPTGVLWHNFIDYDSKKETGFVGLKNKGATSYMHSLLQSLYCTKYFRKAVYQIPTDDDDPLESVPLALQRVFYHLQTSDQSVGTDELTRSFGWKSLDPFLQYDVREFSRVLQELLEFKMKGTPAEGAITKLFAGRVKSYIKCINVNFTSSRTEDFHDIQLNVKGMKNLWESFKDYIFVETLEGDNKYQAEGYGLQDAKKGVIFQSFPDVLHLQLKRLEHDLQRDTTIKINDRHEFPFELDLGEFIDESANRTGQLWLYKLHGVLVHSGDVHGGGHYFAFIKPDQYSSWLKYGDDRVTPVTDKEVLEENYGGDVLTASGAEPTKKPTSAYMLVYVRESAYDVVFAPFTEGDTPVHLKRRIEEERLAMEDKKREREEQHLYLTAKVISDLSFTEHQGFDLASFEDNNWPASELVTFRVLKYDNFLSFKALVARHFHLTEGQVRLWVLVQRQNKTLRPDIYVSEKEPAFTIEQVRDTMASRASDLRLYLDVSQPAPGKAPFSEADQSSVMIFLKYFNVHAQTLTGVCKVYVNRNSRVASISAIITEKMRWQPTTPLKFYEEIKPGMIEVMKPKLTLAQSEMQDGDIICFQVEIGDKEVQDMESKAICSNAIQFYEFLRNRVLVYLKPFEEKDGEEFELALSKNMDHEYLSKEVGGYLDHDPTMLRFSTTDAQGNLDAPIERSPNQSVWDMIKPMQLYSQPRGLFYERLDMGITELEAKRALTVVWTGIHNHAEQTLSFLLLKANMVYDLIGQIAKQVTLSSPGPGRIRVFVIAKGRQYQKECLGSELLGNLPDVDFYAEEIPVDEILATDEEKIVNAFHYTREPSLAHGIPFRLVLRPGEKFTATKRRIQSRLGVSDRDISEYHFTLISTRASGYKAGLLDDDILYDYSFHPGDFVGLDHPWRN